MEGRFASQKITDKIRKIRESASVESHEGESVKVPPSDKLKDTPSNTALGCLAGELYGDFKGYHNPVSGTGNGAEINN